MAWNTMEMTQNRTVTLVQNGNRTPREFPSTTFVKEAVIAVAQTAGIKKFTVEDTNGRNIEEEDGNKTLAEIGNLIVYPDAVAA